MKEKIGLLCIGFISGCICIAAIMSGMEITEYQKAVRERDAYNELYLKCERDKAYKETEETIEDINKTIRSIQKELGIKQ